MKVGVSYVEDERSLYPIAKDCVFFCLLECWDFFLKLFNILFILALIFYLVFI